jgi:hypothetical protein
MIDVVIQVDNMTTHSLSSKENSVFLEYPWGELVHLGKPGEERRGKMGEKNHFLNEIMSHKLSTSYVF